MGRCKSLASFLSYAPHLSGAGIPCFHILSFLRVHHGEWLQSDSCWMADILSFLSSLGAHQLTIGVAAITDDCDVFCLPVWWEIFHLS